MKDNPEAIVEDNNIEVAIRKINRAIQISRRVSLMKRRGLHPGVRSRRRAKRIANDKRLRREEMRKNGKKK